MPPLRTAAQVAPARRGSDGRRAVVPQVAGRSLWGAAAWTGAGTAFIGTVGAIALVALCWLPASGASGHTSAALKAGVLSFLAALHGGATLDGSPTRFVPLGMTMLVGVLLYRGGSGLGDAAEALGERDPLRLLLAAALQAAAFTTTCLLLVGVSRLGTSGAPVVGVGVASLVLCGGIGTWGLARASALGGAFRRRIPPITEDIARSAGAALLAYVAAAALLTGASLLVHHSQVEAISGQAGGGWSGVPVLALGILSAPNAVISAIGYLAGPGFAVGAGTTVSLGDAAHGLVPAFPLLGALPQHPAGLLGWTFAAAVPVVAGWLAVRLLPDRRTWRELARDFGLVALTAGLAMGLLAWQAGGGIGSGRLATIGASPWRVAVTIGIAVAAGQWLVIGALAAWQWYQERDRSEADGAAHHADADSAPAAVAEADADPVAVTDADPVGVAKADPVADGDADPVADGDAAIVVATALDGPAQTAPEARDSATADSPEAGELAG